MGKSNWFLSWTTLERKALNTSVWLCLVIILLEMKEKSHESQFTTLAWSNCSIYTRTKILSLSTSRDELVVITYSRYWDPMFSSLKGTKGKETTRRMASDSYPKMLDRHIMNFQTNAQIWTMIRSCSHIVVTLPRQRRYISSPRCRWIRRYSERRS